MLIISILMNGYSARGKHAEAEKVLERMREANVYPDSVAFNTLLHCFACVGAITSAASLLDQMEEQEFAGYATTTTATTK